MYFIIVSVTIRPTNTSPYKKPLIPPTNAPVLMSAPGAPMNRLQQGKAFFHFFQNIIVYVVLI